MKSQWMPYEECIINECLLNLWSLKEIQDMINTIPDYKIRMNCQVIFNYIKYKSKKNENNKSKSS